MWTHLWCRPTLSRLGVVVLTTLLVTCLIQFWGPPFPYRVGEVYPYDVYVRVEFQRIDRVEQLNIPGSPSPGLITPVTTEGPALASTHKMIPPAGLKIYPAGEILVERNTPISEMQLALLKEEHKAYRNSLTSSDHLLYGFSLFLIFSLLAGLIVVYVARFQPDLSRHLHTLAGISLLVVLTVEASLVASLPPWYAVFLPLTVTAIILTLAYNPQFALLMSLSLSVVLIVALGRDMSHFLVLLSGLAAVILLLRNIRTRTQLIQVCCLAGVVFALMTLATGILSGQTWKLILADSARRFVWGTLAGFLLTGLLPVVERVFGIVTDISLRELADGSHPLLQELVRRAPGTYTHSITVATLAETAAEAIDANPLLVRVGSYFHDVGKMLKPHYFVENQNGENRHDSLEPALSTLIIIGHVKDGIALARQYNLPRPVIEFIEQHHGTTLVEYFYREALRLQQANGYGNGQNNGELESTFRYPGPKPQTRESGILMLADAVESASRALHDPTPARIRKLVHDLMMKRLLDGQFEESGLTLSELHIIEESLCKGLIALFHVRIRYQEEEELQDKAS